MNALLLVLVVVLVAGTGTLFANDAPVRSVGKSIRPREGVQVRMMAETVDILIDNSVAYVKCVFTLVSCADPAFPYGTYVDMTNDPAMLLKDLEAK